MHKTMKQHLLKRSANGRMPVQDIGINKDAKPSGTGCKECLESGTGWWLHLRRCAECGHIGCCDSSPMRHATKHSHESMHPIIQSFEPGENWFFNYVTGSQLPAHVALAMPRSHPASQPVPFYLPNGTQSEDAE